MYRRFLLLVLAGISFGHAFAQQNLRVASSISSSATPIGKTYYANRNDPPRAVEFNPRTVSSAHFVANVNKYLSIPSDFTFTQTESNSDELGMLHRRLQQFYQGVPLEGMAYRVHEKDGFVVSVNGKGVRNLQIDTQPKISAEQAFRLAVTYLNTKDTTFRDGRLLIVSKNPNSVPRTFFLAFQFDIDVSFIESYRISIDAHTGEFIKKVSLVNTCGNEPTPKPLPYGTAAGLTNYYGNQTVRVDLYGSDSRLQGETAHGGKIGTYDFGNVSIFSLVFFFEWHEVSEIYSSSGTYNGPRHKEAVSVQYAAEQAYEYFFTKHNRNSFDNLGSEIKSYVHVDAGLKNAFWTHNLLAFGDGLNNDPLVELDVVAHELTHGVTQFEAGLYYNFESGALNESFSDIFGKAAEFNTFGDTASWILSKHAFVGGLRDFSNPNNKNQPDTYLGDLWYTGYEDNGGVHYNSGVQNHWFYLLCEGGSGVNDHNFNYSVNAIGMAKAAKVAYRNLTEYLDIESDYLDSRIGSMLSAADLYGSSSSTREQVEKAWDAVGVIDEPILTGLEVYDITATTVKIKGSLVPRAESATYHFEYGTTLDFGNSTDSYDYTDKVEGIITGLQSETTYYLKLVGTNENGSTYTTIEFTTIALDPLVYVKKTADVSETTAALYGKVNPNSLPTTFWFEYGLTPALGLATPPENLQDTTEYLDVSAAISDLESRKTYYFRLAASNASATTYSETVELFTAVRPVITSFTPLSAAPGTEVVITGQNFNSVAEKNLVSFGATTGTVSSVSATQLTVRIPAGASLGPITVLDLESGLASESPQDFVPTFSGEFDEGSLQLRMAGNERSTGNYLSILGVQDMDGDGKPDLVANQYLGISVFVNTVSQGGDISESSFVRSIFNITEYSWPSILGLEDFDGNGLKDIIGYFDNVLTILPNLSVPGYIFFGSPVRLPNVDMFDLTFNDFDMDGHVDIIGQRTIGIDSCIVQAYRNQNPVGTLTAENFEKKEVGMFPFTTQFLRTADVNNDGAPDLLISPYDQSMIGILKNTGHPGNFRFDTIVVADPTSKRFVDYIAHDLNGDSWKDVIGMSWVEAGPLSVFENTGSSENIMFDEPVITASSDHGMTAQAGDLNGDGKVDLLISPETRSFQVHLNKTSTDGDLSATSFQNLKEFGTRVPSSEYGSVRGEMLVSDLNADGRPEVICNYYFSYYPYDGYGWELWQNAQADCPDPSKLTFSMSGSNIKTTLPENTTFDQFHIEYAIQNTENWYTVTSESFGVQLGYAYKIRARARCFLGYTPYYYKNLGTDCIDTSSLKIISTASTSITVSATNLSSIEVQYSVAGKQQWMTMSQYNNVINGLSPGTNYDLRYRGRCYNPVDYTYKAFTTLCPALSSINVTDVRYDRATINFVSDFRDKVLLEYSADNVNWIGIGNSGILTGLKPATNYSVRGVLTCTDTTSSRMYTSFATLCANVSTVNVSETTPYTAEINWSNESAATSFTVKYAPTFGGETITKVISSSSLLIDNLIPGTRYLVEVAPACAGAQVFTSTSFTTVCYGPYNLSVNEITPSTAALAWNDDFGGNPFTIEYSITGSNTWLTAQTESTAAMLTNLRPGTEYELRIHIECPDEPEPSASTKFETELFEETVIVPNPTNQLVTIRPSKDLIGRNFILHDPGGRIVSSGVLTFYTMDLSNFSATGIYTLKIEGEKPMKILKY